MHRIDLGRALVVAIAVLVALQADPARAGMGERRSGDSGAGQGDSFAPAAGERDGPLLAAPVDPDTYRVGPGDVLSLAVPGVIEGRATLVVDAEGGLVLPGSAGRIQVAGLTLNAARESVGRALSALVRDRPFALSLEHPRRFKVYVTGAVKAPGAIEASAVARISEVIALAGGAAPRGSERRIQVRRAGGSELTADLLRFRALGALDANPLVEGGDVVHVPALMAEFTILGGVPFPGTYELVPGETLESAVALAGGPLPGARTDAVELSRTAPATGARTEALLDLENAADRSRPLVAGDALVLPRAVDLHLVHAVLVTGEVAYPGRYPITPGVDTVGDVIRRAGGFTSVANRGGARLFRAPWPEGPRAVAGTSGGTAAAPAGAEGATARRRAAPAVIEPTDSTPAVAEPTDSTPGFAEPAFSALPRTMRERELLRLSAGGRELAIKWQDEAFADSARLAAGDEIHVPRAERAVRVDGRVRAPGLVPFAPERGIEDYVDLAGGFDKNADRGRMLVQRAGRPALEYADGAGPIGDGDAIWVPEKAPRSAWTLTREIITLGAAVASIVFFAHEVAQ